MTTSTTGGSISITQVNGNSDSATVASSTAGGNVTISQGIGNSDTATIDPTTAGGNVTITQGNGNTDVASVLGVSAGTSTTSFGFVTGETGGLLTITQGNGYNDTATLNSVGAVNDSFANVNITQGNSIAPASVVQTPLQGDVVNVNDTNILSDLIITQGTTAAVGNYIVNIGGLAGYFGSPPSLPGLGSASAVTVGHATEISQHGEDNSDFLGGASAPGGTDFTTNYLDIITSFVADTNTGGGFVQAQNTVVVLGSFLGNPWEIDGAGGGNAFWNVSASSTGISANPANFTSF